MSKRQAHGQPAKRSGKVVKEAGADVKGPAAKNKRSRDVHEAPIDYKGYRPAKGEQIARVSCTAITPEEFFDTYVARRRPVVIEGLSLQSGSRFASWTNSYLMKRAGAAIVQIEEKGDAGSFGTGKEKHRMPFGDFVKKVESGEDKLYLTTQYDADGDDEAKLTDLLPPPVSHLVGDFPLRPALLPTLVPQQLNMWMGHSADGASSGLHCDFHDNLYLLLRGRKRFLLFAPSDAHSLYLHGTLQRVHHNGLLSFSRGIRADGAPLALVDEWEAQEAARRIEETRRARAKKGAAKGGEGDGADVDDAEDEAEEALMEAALDRAGDDAADDFADLNEDVPEAASDSEPEELDDAPRKRKRRAESSKRKEQRKEASKGPAAASAEPPSFSRIDVPTLRSALRSPLYPRLAEACGVSVELNEGDALYLPASWFHEVTSYSGGKAGHLAFNYWFHPPSTANFKAPYEDEFWASRFAKLQAQIKAT